MSSRCVTCLIVWTLSFGLVAHAYGAIVYNETSGDLSPSGLAPTPVPVAAGSNQILGTTGFVTSADRDYFTITVPSGLELISLTILPGTGVGATLAFIGLQEGPQVTVPTQPVDATGLLGWHHYSSADINTDILPAMGTAGFGSSGFVPPLGAGDYTFWIQDTSPGRFAYGLDLVLAPVPEPGTLAMILAGIAAIGIVRRRRE